MSFFLSTSLAIAGKDMTTTTLLALFFFGSSWLMTSIFFFFPSLITIITFIFGRMCVMLADFFPTPFVSRWNRTWLYCKSQLSWSLCFYDDITLLLSIVLYDERDADHDGKNEVTFDSFTIDSLKSGSEVYVCFSFCSPKFCEMLESCCISAVVVMVHFLYCSHFPNGWTAIIVSFDLSCLTRCVSSLPVIR